VDAALHVPLMGALFGEAR